MLCDRCWGMLRGHEGRVWKGTYDLHFNHHSELQQLETSAALLCGICRRLHDLWIESDSPAEDVSGAIEEPPLKNSLEETNAQEGSTTPKPHTEQFSSSASLSVVRGVDEHDLFRLDFRLKCGGKTKKRTFVLKQTDDAAAPFKTPVARNMSSDEVFKQAVTWYNKCKCAKSRPDWHPTRLIDLQKLKTRVKTEGALTILKGRLGWDTLDDVLVRVVEKGDAHFPQIGDPAQLEKVPEDDNLVDSDGFNSPNTSHNRYVTLSHCWGGKDHRPIVLDNSTKSELLRGIKLRDLPDTYKQAIQFAAQMDDVGWIWIDSLCIIQDDEKDWTHESSDMQRVYRESFLNISATASHDSMEGLYRNRIPRTLWEDEINLKVDGIYGLEQKFSAKTTPGTADSPDLAAEPAPRPNKVFWLSAMLKWFRPAAKLSPRREGQDNSAEGQSKTVVASRSLQAEGVRRCILVDVSHWDDIINHAPVNVRAWVLQERLLAPRVLHFCKGQIAWECGEFEQSEGYPTDIPQFLLRDDRILPKPLNKGLIAHSHGRELRSIRLRGEPEPDMHLVDNGLYELELWSRIVEDYSRLNLTEVKDKLVALSGIAAYMAKEVIGSESAPAIYVAGLWHKHLASQLLWKIEPVFKHSDWTFHHPSRRPQNYRAPSFSWASVDAQLQDENGIIGTGITYGEITDRDLLIEVDTGPNAVNITRKAPRNLYGEVTGGHVMIWGQLRQVKLYQGGKGRYYWKLLGRSEVCPPAYRDEFEREEHRNVYLDCPKDDLPHQGVRADNVVYCMPAAKGGRTEEEYSKYIICLLLQHVPESDERLVDWPRKDRQGVYRRIGLTKLSTWADKYAYQVIDKPLPTDINYPQRPFRYDENGRGRSLICVI